MIKWTLFLDVLFFHEKTGLAAIWIDDLFSQNNCTSNKFDCLTSCKILITQINSEATIAIALYSDSSEDLETILCFYKMVWKYRFNTQSRWQSYPTIQ